MHPRLRLVGDKWGMADERLWLRTLSEEQLLGYLASLPLRSIAFQGEPATPEFRAELRRHAEHALELLAR